MKENNRLTEFVESIVPQPAIAREGWLRVSALVGLGLLTRWVASRTNNELIAKFWRGVSNFLLPTALLVAYTYRDPQREPIGNASDYVYSPTDGKIVSIEQVDNEPLFVGSAAYRLEISSHLLDVPIQRTPLPGRVSYIYRKDQAIKFGLQTSEGERILLTYEAKPTLPVPLADSQIIFIRPQVGQTLDVTDKFAVRGFGQPLLTIVYLPTETMELLCHNGQHVQAGMTVIGRIKQ